MKKSKLIVNYEFEFELLGITTPIKGYKLAWAINQRLQIHLVKHPDLIVGFKKGDEKSFSAYVYETRLTKIKLLKNMPNDGEGGKYFLVPEFPHFDYILYIKLTDTESSFDLQAIKDIPDVLLAAPIPLDNLKSKSNFVF